MASLIKPAVVRWLLAGKRVRPGTPGAVKVRTEARKWYAQNVPGHGRKKVPLATNRKVAERMLADLILKSEWSAAGVHADQPLEPLLAEWAATIGGGETHRREVVNHARLLLSACGLRGLADLRRGGLAGRVEQHLAALVAGDAALAPRTAAAYGAHTRQFTRWLWRKKGLFPSDPLAGLDLPSQAPRTPRCDLSPTELACLCDVAKNSPRTVKHLSGPSRAVLYLTAAATGYRAGELAAITKGDLHLDEDPPTVRLSGEYTKNGKDASQPIPPAVACVLKAHTASHLRQDRVWPGLWYKKAAVMIRVDLAAAGIVARLAGGRRDFHSLRHSYASMIALVAPASVLHDLTRHGDVATTLKHYAHASDAAKLAAVQALPLPGVASPELTREQVGNLAGVVLVSWLWFLGGVR